MRISNLDVVKIREKRNLEDFSSYWQLKRASRVLGRGEREGDEAVHIYHKPLPLGVQTNTTCGR